MNKRNQNHGRYNFDHLEPRHLLAGDAGGSYLPDLAQERLVRNYLTSNPETAHLQEGASDLRLVEIKHGLASTTTRFLQTYEGLTVHNAYVTVNQGPEGDFQRVFDQGHEKLIVNDPIEPYAYTSLAKAEAMAIDHAGISGLFADTRGEFGWYVDEEGSATKAWQVTVFGMNPTGDYLTMVDALNNKLVSQENRAAFATGTGDVFYPNPYQTIGNGDGFEDANDGDNFILDSQLISVTLEGLDDDTDLLIGEFVDLATLNSPSLPDNDASEPTRVYEYTRSDDRFEQVVIYHTVDQINRYFHTLGFDDDSGVPNGIRDFPTLANAHWDTADNSFYSTGDDAIHFGDGGVDDGEDGDIIAHEYGHAVQFNQNAGWGGGEMGAMGEGFGDYLAASFFFDEGNAAFQADHAAAVGEWDATSYSSDDPPNLRRVDGDKMYPGDLNGSVHDDGEIWSAALWDMRAAIGGTAADQLVLESHFGLPSGATMPVAAQAIIDADININGGVNVEAIRQAFIDRGILSPLPTEGNVEFNKGTYLPTDTVNISILDSNAMGPISVTVTSTAGDSETVSMMDMGMGVFTGTITTAEGSATPGSGVLEVALGHVLTVTYEDADNGSGGTSTSTDEATIANVREYPSTDTPLNIEDNTTFTSTINVPDSGTVIDVDVELNITHTFTADLDVFLTGPGGQVVELFQDVGGGGDNFTETVLDDEASEDIGDGTAPFTGSFRPAGSFTDFDMGSMTGDWVLSITDDAGGDTGTLDSWALFIDTVPTTLGIVAFDANGYNLGDTVNFTVTDSNASGPISVDLTSSSGDAETITLTDEGGGVFSGSITTEDAANQSDGVLQVQLGSIITVSYEDVDDGAGNQTTLTDTANIRNVLQYDSEDVPLDIEDNTTFTSEIVIADEGTVADVDALVNITHTFDADLDIFLVSPSGTRVELFTDVGGGGDNFVDTILDDDAATSIGAGSAPFTGTFSPEGTLADFNGESITGTWLLEVSDDAGGDTGTLDAWSLAIDVIPPDPILLDVAGPGTITEGDSGSSTADFTVTLDSASTDVVTVDYATTVAGMANPATIGFDIDALSGTLTFNPGETSKTISVTVHSDLLAEHNEEFGIELTNASGGNIGVGLATGLIGDDEATELVLQQDIDFGPDHGKVGSGDVGLNDYIYDGTKGYGWTSVAGHGTFEGSRGVDMLRIDGVSFDSGSFVIDVTPNEYRVQIVVGIHNGTVDDAQISIEGEVVDVVSTFNSFTTFTYPVNASDGQINIDLEDITGDGSQVSIAGIKYIQKKTLFRPSSNAGSGKSLSGANLQALAFVNNLDVKLLEVDAALPTRELGVASELERLELGGSRFEWVDKAQQADVSPKSVPADTLVELFDEVEESVFLF